MTSLPQDLTAAIRDGRAVLFLGAGASRGGKGPDGQEAPTANELALQLSKSFLGEDYSDLDLRSAYDLSCSARDVRTVQAKIFELLDPIQPASFHRSIPEFPWAGIMTTNYDLIIERAYAASKGSQGLVPYTKDGDGATDRVTSGDVLYIKLHGCISRSREVEPPLIASTEQLISYKQGRIGQFDTFLEWAKTKTFIFCGYSFLDPNLRALFDEVIREGDKRPRHYIINKGARSAEIEYWRDRRVVALDATFEDLIIGLESAIPPERRALGAIFREWQETSFSQFITTPDRKESESLTKYLNSQIEHVHTNMAIGGGDPKRFTAALISVGTPSNRLSMCHSPLLMKYSANACEHLVQVSSYPYY